MQASTTVPDKELVLRVLEMYPDVTKREEEEIRNMAATYKGDQRADPCPSCAAARCA
ncbi:MAG: hypothetical protein IPF41_05485 [Flavobacteriales bacterium]|nr:hypothetical protein [Flavobacteriales bacterium]